MARSNRVAVPEAKQSLKNFKTEVANSMNITLNDGYNGDISARDAGRLGGQMVKRMIEYAENNRHKRSKERRKGKEGRSRWSPDQS